MNIIPTEAATEYLDALTAIYLLIRGSDPAGAGAPSNPTGFGLGLLGGSWGAASLVGNVVQAVTDSVTYGGTDGIDAVVTLGSLAETLANSVNAKTVAGMLLAAPLGGLGTQIASSSLAGASSLDTYLTVLNTTGPDYWGLLVPPACANMCSDATNTPLSLSNVWFEVLQGSVYTNALGEEIIGTGFTAGFTVDNTQFAGGFPYVNVVAPTGTGIIQVTGTAFNPATLTSVSGVTWVYDLTVATAGDYPLVPGGSNAAPANSLILACSAIDPGTVSAGTLYAEAHRPTGRAVFNF